MSDAPLNSHAIARAIVAGELDDDLDFIGSAMRERRKLVRAHSDAQTRAALRPGDVVRMSDDCRPTRYRGLPGKVVRITNTRIVVDVEGVGELRCPPSLVVAS